MRRWHGRLVAALGLTLALAAPARAQTTGTVMGTVVDAAGGAPVGFVQLLLEEAGRSTASGADGSFVLRNVPPGISTLKTFRVGYERVVRTVEVPAGDTLHLTLRLSATPVMAGEVVVESAAGDAAQLADAALELEGRRLRRNLGTTIAETLSDEPGLAMRAMGPAPARPVLRGLGGERVLVLEDGARTGDLSAASTDHAVVIEPLTAERVEVVRGPAALIYGANVLGGVVNVTRGAVPSSVPAAPAVAATLQGQSVNRGLSAGLSAVVPAGTWALRVDGALRRASDVHTPDGVLDNTALATYNGGAGASLVRPWGFAGASGGYYRSRYGIPGGFVGAHPNGVDIEMERAHGEVRSEVVPGLAWAPRLEMRVNATHYYHRELEKSGSVGAEYALDAVHARGVLYTQSRGAFRKGAVGAWGTARAFAAGGATATPNAHESAFAVFGYQDVHFGRLTLQSGLRFDVRHVVPATASASALIGQIRARTFRGLSGGVTVLAHPAEHLTVGASLMRSLRLPGIEELYSEGPHLAAYSFEVGNPDLEAEGGTGGEVFVRVRTARIAGTAAVFANRFDGYIFPRNTGRINPRNFLPIYATTGAPARMLGGEASFTASPARRLELEATASYVRGTFTDTDVPMPFIPPLRGTLGATYRLGALSAGATLHAAAAQDRVYRFADAAMGTPEVTTDGYLTLDTFASLYLGGGSHLHTIDLVVENVTDAVYRDHLSRVRSIMPEPGRNVRLLYRVYW